MNKKNSERTSFTQLPQSKELHDMLPHEAQRPIPEGKENAHYPKFETAKAWLESIGLFYPELFSLETEVGRVVELGTKTQDEVVKKTLEAVRGGEARILPLIQSVTEYLSEEDVPQKSDQIFVFGSKSLSRVEAAVKLYNKGFAPIIFIAGDSPYYEEKPTESLLFKERAIELGIPEDKIITEIKSFNIPDNVRSGLNLMDELGLDYDRLILVTAWFAQRRSWAHMMKYVPQETQLYRVSPEIKSGTFAQDGWYRDETGIKVVFNEFVKMQVAVNLNTA